MAADVSAAKCRHNLFVAETYSKKLKTFVLETKILCRRSVCPRNVCRRNVCRRNVCRRNVCRRNVCRRNVCRRKVCRRNVLLPDLSVYRIDIEFSKSFFKITFSLGWGLSINQRKTCEANSALLLVPTPSCRLPFLA